MPCDYAGDDLGEYTVGAPREYAGDEPVNTPAAPVKPGHGQCLRLQGNVRKLQDSAHRQ